MHTRWFGVDSNGNEMRETIDDDGTARIALVATAGRGRVLADASALRPLETTDEARRLRCDLSVAVRLPAPRHHS